MEKSTKEKVKQLSEEELDKVSGGMGGKKIDDNPVTKKGGCNPGSKNPSPGRDPHVL